jgi:hypothetical protein
VRVIIVSARFDWDSVESEWSLDIDNDRSCHVCVDKAGLVAYQIRTKLGYQQPGMVMTRESAIALRDCLISALTPEPKRFSAWTYSMDGDEKATGITEALRAFVASRLPPNSQE